MESPPPRVSPGSPWSNVAADVPSNGATIDEVRFWTYQKLGNVQNRLTGLCTATNYMLDNVKLAHQELNDRPTFEEVGRYVQDKLAEYVTKQEHVSQMKTLAETVTAAYPTVQQTEKFVKDSAEETSTRVSVLAAQVEAAMHMVDGAIEDTKKNVKWIEGVEAEFRRHVNDNFANLQGAVEGIRTRLDGHPCGHTDGHAKNVPLQPPPGCPSLSGEVGRSHSVTLRPQEHGMGDFEDCKLQSTHCRHVVQLMTDVQELKVAYRTFVQENGVAHNLVQAQLEKVEAKIEQRQSFLRGGTYNDPNGTQSQAPQGAPGGDGRGPFGVPHGVPVGAPHGVPGGAAPGGGHGGPGGRAPGGGYPGGGYGTDQAHGAYDRLDYNKLFDDKVALSQEYGYSGGDGGDRWRAKARGYIISKCPDMLGVLNWVEKCDQKEITEGMLTEKTMYGQHGGFFMTELCVPRLSGVLWGFLNTCLKGEAHTVFEGADLLNGLEGWRLVVQDIQRGRSIRMATLRKLVKHPPHVTKLEDVASAMLKYQNVLKEYKAVDGILPSEEEQKSDLLDTLPQELRENLMWRATNKPEERLSDFQNHIRGTVNEILFHRGKLSNTVNTVEIQEGVDKVSELENMLGAMMQRMGFKPNGGSFSMPRAGAPRPEGARRPPSDRPARCANCGGLNHTKDECPKPKVPMNQRPCHECGKPGHIAANCRSKGGRNAGLVEDEDEGDDVLCMEFQDVCSTRRRGRPVPRPATLADFVPTVTKNRFRALEADERRPEKSKAMTVPQVDEAMPPWDELEVESESDNSDAAEVPNVLEDDDPKVLDLLDRMKRTLALGRTTSTTLSGSGARSCAPTDEAVSPKPSVKSGDRAGFDEDPCPSTALANGPRRESALCTEPACNYCEHDTTQRSAPEGHVNISERKARRDAARRNRAARRVEDWKKADRQMVTLNCMNEPNEYYCLNPQPNDIDFQNEPNSTIGTIVYQDADCEDEIMAAEEEIEVDVAVDSGCVAHVCGPDDIPTSVKVEHPPGKRRRNFVAANGSDMENYGEASIEMVQGNGQVFGSTFTVTDVTRPLHSTSQICDTASQACPEGHEVLYTKDGATVVPGGTLSKFLGSVRHVANYPRRGGLYVAKMKVRAPGTRATRRPNPKKPGAQGFGRQGAKR